MHLPSASAKLNTLPVESLAIRRFPVEESRVKISKVESVYRHAREIVFEVIIKRIEGQCEIISSNYR